MDDNLLRTALTGLLIGGGGYGAFRLAHDIPKAAKGDQKDNNELDIPIPKAVIKKNATDGDWASNYLYPALAGVGGAAAGWGGASAIYEHMKRKAMEKDLAKQEEQYMATLQQIHNKMGSEFPETPFVDKFLEGVIEKLAGSGISMDDISGGGWQQPLKNAWNGAWNTDIGQKVLTAAAILALGTGAATYGLAHKQDAEKEKAKQESTFPDTVNLRPY
jgi:hypothetical protein